MKTGTLYVEHKDPDGLGELAEALGLDRQTRRKYFSFGEYVRMEIQIDENMNIVGGRVLPSNRGG